MLFTMKTKLLNLRLLGIMGLISGAVFGQDVMLNDFEAGSPAVTASYGAVFTTVANTVVVGNPTANCGEIRRTSGNWYELVRFATSFNVPANATKYVHLRVMYTSAVVPNFSIRVDAAADSDGATDIHVTTSYDTSVGGWQDMVFRIDGGDTGVDPTQMLFFADASVSALNDTTSFAYIDEMVLSATETPFLGINTFGQNSAAKVYPNPTNGVWNFESANTFSSVQIIDITGKTVINQNLNATKVAIDASGLAGGIYIAKLNSATAVQTFRVVKN